MQKILESAVYLTEFYVKELNYKYQRERLTYSVRDTRFNSLFSFF